MKKLLLVAIAFAAFAVGYGVVAKAYPSPAPYGRAAYHGYFSNTYDDQGTFVLPKVYDGSTHAIPNSVLNTNAFISFIESQIGGSSQKTAGASFIIQTMIGSSRNKPPTGGEIAQWENLVRGYAAAGRINWNISYCFNLNTYYQGTSSGPNPADDAFYSDSDCKPVILFYDPNGSNYAIKHECANPVGNGNLTPLTPVSNWSMSGRTTVDNPTLYPGQSTTFRHYVKNNGPTSTNGQDIWFAILDGTSGATIQGGQDSGAYNAGEEKNVANLGMTVPNNAAPGSQICQKVLYDWANSGGGRNGTGGSVCVTVLDITPGCGSATTAPGTFDPTDPYTLNAYVNIAGGAAGATYVNGTSNFFLTVKEDATGNTVYNNSNVTPTTIGTNGGNGTISVSQGLPPVNKAGNYTVSYGITGPVSAITCPGSFRVSYSPFYSVMEGDVSAGPDFGTGGICTAERSAILGNNRGAIDNYYGSGSQLGAFALAPGTAIGGFATNSTRNSGPGNTTNSAGGSVSQPSGLAFANSGTSATVWGTTFGRDPIDAAPANSCVPDYYKTAKAGATTIPTGGTYLLNQAAMNGLTSGKTYFINGNVQTAGDGAGWLYLNGPGMPSRVTLVVHGDVWINSHIAYKPYNYVSGTTSVASIPQFQLIVQGNIYIDRGVTALTGFYAAQPDVGAKGMIYTCSSNFKYLTDDAGDASPNALQDGTNYYSHCSNQLTVFGSVAAKGIKLNRVHGHRKNIPGQVSNDPAEQFIYTPDLWMGNLNATTSGPQPFDAMTNLPPIL